MPTALFPKLIPEIDAVNYPPLTFRARRPLDPYRSWETEKELSPRNSLFS